MIKKIVFLSLVSAAIAGISMAKEIENLPPSGGHRPGEGTNQLLSGCTPSKAVTSLDINNVSTIILINGDMWWNAVSQVNTARYEIPKGSGKTSLFASAIWVGGKDAGNNLHIAAQTYRQQGYDFWPGPLDTTTTSITPTTCNQYDKHFKLLRSDVENFTADWNVNHENTEIPDDIKNWPGNGTDPQSHFLAPYYDYDGDGVYNPENGDFPKFYFTTLPNGDSSHMDPCSKDVLLGDMNLWWVFNDVGNIHTETGSPYPIGLEVRAQAFAFTTNDDINNMTFYRYQIINRNTSLQLNNTYFGAWVDPDLGLATDDFVGCDVKRSLGIVYNSDENDEGAQGYGINPPSAGLDFFEGPLADVGDGKDNNRDSCVDCTVYLAANGDTVRIKDDNTSYTINNGSPVTGPYISGVDTISGREQIIMSGFVFYTNGAPAGKGDPTSATEYYNYLSNKWADGTNFTFGGLGKGDAGTGSGVTSPPTTTQCKFVYPGTSDPYGWGTNGVITAANSSTSYNWSEETAGAAGDDRRFMQSAGTFTLLPGAVNYITTGAVWARASSGGRLASVSLLRRADDYAQGLFDHCFKVTNGPDAPDVQVRELSKEIILTLTNDNPLRNNYKESYAEIDPNIATHSVFSFEGYRIFQLKDANVTSQDLCDADKAREIGQVDIKNGVGQIINYVIGKVPCSNISPAGSNWNAYVAVDGADKGIRHSGVITTDAFTSAPLVNHRTYYYMVLAYGYNKDEVPPIDPYTTPVGKNSPYIAGRNNVKVYAAVPHEVNSEMGGTIANSAVGDGPEITRIEGAGDGIANLNGLEFKSSDNINPDGVVELEAAPYFIHHPTYAQNRGPVDVQIYDPYKVSGGDFELWATDTVVNDTIGRWILKNLGTGKIDTSHKTLEFPYEQVFTDYGFYINMFQNSNAYGYAFQPGDSISTGKIESGFIQANQVNQGANWLSGVADRDGTTAPTTLYDWIASGTASTDLTYYWGSTTSASTGIHKDDDQTWESLLGGTWAPYRFTRGSNAVYTSSPAYSVSPSNFRDVRESYLASVDVVFTSNKNLWTKCPVIEMQYKAASAIGNAPKNTLRRSPSLDKDFNVIPGDSGFSYFPGYAVNIETGERLNMAFGEDSYVRTDTGFSTNIGGDMKWNPDANDTLTDLNNPGIPYYSLGGKHVVFVFSKIDSVVMKPTAAASTWDTLYMPVYDDGVTLATLLRRTGTRPLRQAWATCGWVGYTKLASGFTSVPLYSGPGNDARVRIRVMRPYVPFNTGVPSSPLMNNNSFPHYTFGTGNFAVTKGNSTIAKSALDSINVVPNPYYAYSDYDKKPFDNRIKIVNLPSNCTVSIYTPNGTLIRKLYRDVSNLSEGTSVGGDIQNPLTFDATIDWDLRNEKGVPIASGIYLIHVEAPGLGERTLKWFGVLRPIDLDTF
jgi:hypothetical protein